MDELKVVEALEMGAEETEVCTEFGLTLEQMDEIMEAHDRKCCAGCGTWMLSMEIPDEHCPECS